MMILRPLALGVLLLCALPARAEVPRPELRRYALLVGANDGGRERVRLRYAGSDAEAMARVLSELGGVAPQDRTVLREADRASVLEALARLRQQLAQAPKGARTEVLFYYSGHSDERGLLLKEEQLGYRELRTAIDQLPADVRIAILDSCASGAFTRLKGGKRRQAFLADASTHVRGHAILTSSSEDEVSQESDRISGSYFTHHLVSGLRGAADQSRDGRVTLNEAYQFAFDETLSRTEKTQAGPQHAAYDIQLAGTGDLVMTDVRATNAGLTVAAAVEGQLFVRDARGTLVVELAKRAGRPSELGLAPGAYRITRASGDARWVAEVTLAAGKHTSVETGDFQAVAREAVVTRGGGPRPSQPDDHQARFLNLSLVPGLATNDLVGGPVDNGLSVALLAGRSARLHGAALSLGTNHVDGAQTGAAAAPIANTAGGEVRGAQLSLGGNWAHAQLDGVQATVGLNVAAANAGWLQLAVGGNVAGCDFTGVQLAVGASLIGCHAKGLQGSVGLNWTQQDLGGLQLAAGFNGAPGEMVGVQMAVGANYAGRVRGLQLSVGPSIAGHATGLQLSLLNVGGEVHGAQVGLINVAHKVRGAQVGLINLASEADESVGLLSLVRNGRFNVEAYGSDLTPANVALKMGGRHLYTYLAVGSGLPGEGGRWSTGGGIGVHLPFDRWSLDLDVGTHDVRSYRADELGESLTSQVRAQVAWHLAERLALFAGPTLNVRVLFSPDSPRAAASVIPAATLGDRVELWPGVVAGLRI